MSAIWPQLLSKITSIKSFDLDTSGIEHRQHLPLPQLSELSRKEQQTIKHLSKRSISDIDSLRECVPGQWTKSDHITAAYYDTASIDFHLARWHHLVDVQTECTVHWIQNQFERAKSRPKWSEEIWFDAAEERNQSNNYGLCDGPKWFRFVDTLSIGPYITHPWTPKLTALIAKEIIQFMDRSEQKKVVDILDVGCGIGEFGETLNSSLKTDNFPNINLDGIDRSKNSLNRIGKEYRNSMYIDLCDTQSMKDIQGMFDLIVSSDCLQMSYGHDYAPGSKAVMELMEKVKENGYFLIVNTLQTPVSYKVVCIFDEVLKDKWKEHGFECIADVVVRGYGDIPVDYTDKIEQYSIENNICFVKLMKRS